MKITMIQEIQMTEQGRLLRAAIIKLSTESQTSKTFDEIIEQLNELADKIDEEKTDEQ